MSGTSVTAFGLTSFRCLDCSRYDGSCLSAANTVTAKVEGRQLGQEYDPDTICKMSVGPHSYFGRVSKTPSVGCPYDLLSSLVAVARNEGVNSPPPPISSLMIYTIIHGEGGRG